MRRALYCSKIVSYAQGYMLLRAAAKEYGWNLNMGGIALMWRGGCIIRSQFLGNIKEAFDKNRKLDNLLLDKFFSGAVNKYQSSWRKAISHAVKLGVPTPAFSTALAFFDGYRAGRLPANLLQAQRDLLRRAHLRARRQAARRVLPHQLDGPWRPGFVVDVQRVKAELLATSRDFSHRRRFPRKWRFARRRMLSGGLETPTTAGLETGGTGFRRL